MWEMAKSEFFTGFFTKNMKHAGVGNSIYVFACQQIIKTE